jgi:hypothetical protein
MPYRDYLNSLGIPWLERLVGRAVLGELGGVIDDAIDRAKQAVKARFPLVTPSDGLEPIGSERMLDRGPTESDLSFATRCHRAWELWARAGTPLGLLLALHYGGFPGGVIVQQNGYAHQLTSASLDAPTESVTALGLLATPLTPVAPSTKTIPAGLPWWTFDSQTDVCSRWALLFPAGTTAFMTWGKAIFTDSDSAAITWNNPGRFVDANYQVLVGVPVITDNGGGVVAWEDQTLRTASGTTIRASGPFTGEVTVIAFPVGENPFANIAAGDLARLRRIIRRWRRGAAHCMGIFVLVQGELWDWPVGTWDEAGGTWGPSEVVVFSESA